MSARQPSIRNTGRRTPLRTLSLSDAAWSALGELAEADGRSRSAMVERLVLDEQRRAARGRTRSPRPRS